MRRRRCELLTYFSKAGESYVMYSTRQKKVKNTCTFFTRPTMKDYGSVERYATQADTIPKPASKLTLTLRYTPAILSSLLETSSSALGLCVRPLESRARSPQDIINPVT
jgi:hypothetical protein